MMMMMMMMMTMMMINWTHATSFLQHWPQLKELSLQNYKGMTEKEVMDFMDHLAPPPQLYSLQLYTSLDGLDRSATAAVVDALSRSGLPFFQLLGHGGGNPTIDPQQLMMNPAIAAQLQRNQHNFMLTSDLMLSACDVHGKRKG